MTDIEIFPHVSSEDKISFTKRLALMLRAGIPVFEGLQTLAEQTTGTYFKNIIVQIGRAVAGGQTLEKALSAYPKIFDVLFLHLIKVGEQSGTLDKNLDYLAAKLKKDYELRSKVLSGLMYPGIVLAAAGVVGGGLAIFVLPQMAQLFESLSSNLPLSTKILLFIAGIMKNYGGLVVIGVIGVIGVILILIRTSFIKPFFDQFILRLPIFGKFLQEATLASMCRNLGVMLQAGLPVSTALSAEQAAASNAAYREYLQILSAQVQLGHGIGETIKSKKLSLIPLLVSRTISVGEQTGNLDKTLLYLADFYEEAVENTARNMATILEPLVLIGVGLVVAFVALSIISPIYELTGSIKR